MKEELGNKDKEITDLKEKKSKDENDQLKTLEETISKQNEEIENLKKAPEAKTKKIEEIEIQIKVLQETINKQKDEIDSKDKEIF